MGFALALIASHVGAEIRVTYDGFDKICRVVIVNSTHHRDQVIYDGGVRGSFLKKVQGGRGNTVCYTRSRNPNFCDSGLTAWRCKRDMNWNKTQWLKIE